MNYKMVIARQRACENRWKKLQPQLGSYSGIYILTRIDENGIKYAYVGQAKNIIRRLGQHLLGYQHIDLSLKKHKLYSEDNPFGWTVDVCKCEENHLDEMERNLIKKYADCGYQLRNKTAGGQDTGKSGIDDNKPSRGYYDGLEQGYKNCKKDVKEYFTKYLDATTKTDPKCFKKDGSIKEIYVKKLNEFNETMGVNEK